MIERTPGPEAAPSQRSLNAFMERAAMALAMSPRAAAETLPLQSADSIEAPTQQMQLDLTGGEASAIEPHASRIMARVWFVPTEEGRSVCGADILTVDARGESSRGMSVVRLEDECHAAYEEQAYERTTDPYSPRTLRSVQRTSLHADRFDEFNALFNKIAVYLGS